MPSINADATLVQSARHLADSKDIAGGISEAITEGLDSGFKQGIQVVEQQRKNEKHELDMELQVEAVKTAKYVNEEYKKKIGIKEEKKVQARLQYAATREGSDAIQLAQKKAFEEEAKAVNQIATVIKTNNPGGDTEPKKVYKRRTHFDDDGEVSNFEMEQMILGYDIVKTKLPGFINDMIKNWEGAPEGSDAQLVYDASTKAGGTTHYRLDEHGVGFVDFTYDGKTFSMGVDGIGDNGEGIPQSKQPANGAQAAVDFGADIGGLYAQFEADADYQTELNDWFLGLNTDNNPDNNVVGPADGKAYTQDELASLVTGMYRPKTVVKTESEKLAREKFEYEKAEKNDKKVQIQRGFDNGVNNNDWSSIIGQGTIHDIVQKIDKTTGAKIWTLVKTKGDPIELSEPNGKINDAGFRKIATAAGIPGYVAAAKTGTGGGGGGGDDPVEVGTGIGQAVKGLPTISLDMSSEDIKKYTDAGYVWNQKEVKFELKEDNPELDEKKVETPAPVYTSDQHEGFSKQLPRLENAVSEFSKIQARVCGASPGSQRCKNAERDYEDSKKRVVEKKKTIEAARIEGIAAFKKEAKKKRKKEVDVANKIIERLENEQKILQSRGEELTDDQLVELANAKKVIETPPPTYEEFLNKTK